MITKFNTQLFDISMNSYTLANTAGANGQISYNYETGKLYVHDGFGNKFSNTLVVAQTAPSNQYGLNYGYTIGRSPAGWDDTTQKSSLTSDVISTLVGGAYTPISPSLNLNGNKRAAAGSESNGYLIGGRLSPPSAAISDYFKFSFTSDGDTTDVGELLEPRWGIAGTQSSSYGYASGGGAPYPSTIQSYSTVIQKFPFSSDTNALSVGQLTVYTDEGASSCSTTHGYNLGGRVGTPTGTTPSTNTIRQFPFSSDTSSTDTATLVHRMAGGAATQSEEFGYYVHGNSPIDLNPSISDKIQKFPFASNANAIDVGELLDRKSFGAAYSSQTHGYKAGGYNSSSGGVDQVEKWTFSSDSSSADVSELTYNVWTHEGTKY